AVLPVAAEAATALGSVFPISLITVFLAAVSLTTIFLTTIVLIPILLTPVFLIPIVPYGRSLVLTALASLRPVILGLHLNNL
ncbi:hypothetical protein, partial [Klebsiella pneumoniae]|uniref:hypothetical protein n=1 Tax=Klebsiella pneumoniae TaxID=573 RepID=UPI0039C45F25